MGVLEGGRDWQGSVVCWEMGRDGVMFWVDREVWGLLWGNGEWLGIVDSKRN